MIQETLADQFSPAALKTIIKANLWQDNLIGNLLYPERHFTENKIEEALAYIEAERSLILHELRNGHSPVGAWRAFGRLLHTAQDFYAHSNYVRLWVERCKGETPPPEQIEGLDETLLQSSALHTTRAYRPRGVLAHIPLLNRWLLPSLPPDAHARMNIDAPSRSPLFPYTFAAAKKRALYEYEKAIEMIDVCGQSELLRRFAGKD